MTFKDVAIELMDRLKNGFKLHYTGPRGGMFCNNLISAKDHEKELGENLSKEVDAGRIMGPLPGPPFPNTHISPIGIIPKASGGWRMITHLSYPSSLSINDFIDPDLCSVKYTSFDQVIEMISLLEAGAELGKVDMKNAFRLIRVYPGDFHLLCYKFKDKYYIDKCLPFGCSMSCSIFEKFSTFVHWLTVKQSGLQSMEHYLDDFIFAGKAGTSDCLNLMHCF